jgi:hypothetical protein
MVYGRVFLDKANFSGTGELTFESERGSVTVRPDSKGNYQVLLEPGTYTVTFDGEGGGRWKARIQSYHGPLRQDIRLLRENR